MRKPTKREIFLGSLLLALLLSLAMVLIRPFAEAPSWPETRTETAEEVSLSEARKLLDETDDVIRGGILDDYIYVEKKGGSEPDSETETVKAKLPFPSAGIVSDIAVNAEAPLRIYENANYRASFTDRLFQLLPIILIIAIVVYLLSRGATKGLGLNASFEVIEKDKLKDTFDTVAGIDNAMDEISEIVDFLKNPEDAARLGGRMPKGAIFSGPPGTGKTLLARAMAREAGVPFLSIKASGINQLFVGAGAMKIEKAFKEARNRAPCIVFIDEIDAMGRARGNSQSSAGDEKETTLNSLLVELDGFDAREGVVVIAATNRPEILDPALTRRGRIDRHIHIDLPDIKGREEILNVHVRSIKASPELNLGAVAGTTFGFSGADLAALVNEAALVATRAGKELVGQADFSAARDRLVVGLSGSKRKMSEADKWLTAVHESGHALVAASSKDADRIEKATILPQGGALGYVMQSPDEDRVFETRAALRTRIRVAVAGRAAEEIVFGAESATSGAASDIEAATRIARNMSARFGMGKSGFVHLDPQDPLLYRADGQILEDIANIIRSEIDFVNDLLGKKEGALLGIAEALMEHETIDGAHIDKLLLEHETPDHG